MKYYLEKATAVPGNHDRGPTTDWNRVTVSDTDTAMEFEDVERAFECMMRVTIPGEYRVTDADGHVYGGYLTFGNRAA
jgi:hypothetical protein